MARTRSRETAPGDEPGGVSRISDRDSKSLAGIGQEPSRRQRRPTPLPSRSALQDELQEEIPPLKEKIKTELTPQQARGRRGAPQGNTNELEQGIKMLQSWADAAGDKMLSATSQLNGRQADQAAADQQSAIDELEKIWDAVIPFHALLARDLADQTPHRPFARAGLLSRETRGRPVSR